MQLKNLASARVGVVKTCATIASAPPLTIKEDGSGPRIHPWSEKKAPRSREQAPGLIGGVAFFNSKI
jgi:hypothetical protein